MKYKEIVKQMSTTSAFSKLEKYVDLIEEKNKIMNLTGFSGDKLWKEGILESILSLQEYIQDDIKVADIGAGVGFPTIPLLIFFENSFDLTVIEPLKKRILFLEEVKNELDLSVNLVAERCEEYQSKEEFDLVTARAVMSLNKLIEVTCQLCKVGGKYVFIKGKKAEEELQEADSIINELIIVPKIVKIKEVDDKEINLIIFEKNNSFNPKYPRQWSIIKNQ